MFIDQQKPKDFDCGYNLDLMIAALPRIEDTKERVSYAKRVVGLIKQSHPTWVDKDDPTEHGIYNPYATGDDDDAE